MEDNIKAIGKDIRTITSKIEILNKEKEEAETKMKTVMKAVVDEMAKKTYGLQESGKVEEYVRDEVLGIAASKLECRILQLGKTVGSSLRLPLEEIPSRLGKGNHRTPHQRKPEGQGCSRR